MYTHNLVEFGLPVSDKAVNDVSVVHIDNENGIELLTIVSAQLGSHL